MSIQKLQHLSTAHVGASDRLAHWRHAMCQVGMGGQLKLVHEGFLRASLAQYSLGDVIISYWNSDAIENDRTVQDCAHYPSEQICLSLMKQGRAVVEQRGRKLKLSPGECWLINSSLPSYFKAEPYESVTITLPASAKRLAPGAENYTALPLTRLSDWGKALSAVLAAMTEENIQTLAVHPGILVEQICNLLALIVVRDSPQISTYKHGLLNRLKQDLQAYYHDHDLAPAKVAQKHKIAIRTLHAAFAESGTSFGRELLSIRMCKAAQVLSDPRFSKKTVTEVAELIGYKASSHFITHFKRAYGVTPSEYKKQKSRISL